MDFDQIRCFVAVVREPTFMDAAAALHITQSSLSKQIRKLENEISLSLFDRSRRKASLTPAGQVFYKEALDLLSQYDHMLEAMSAIRDVPSQTIRIGALPILTQYDLTHSLKGFKGDGRIMLDEREEQELLDGIEHGTYDMIIARDHLVRDGSFETYVLARDDLVVILPSGHPLAKAPSLSMETVAREPLILMKAYTSIYHLCMESFARQGLEPNILRTARLETIISAVAEGEGLSLIPKSNLGLFRHDGITAAALCPLIPLNVVLAKKKNSRTSRAQAEFLQYIQRIFPQS